MPLPRRQVLSDDVYDAIKADLLANRLPPGAKINIDELGRDLRVSNTPIRQALSRLEAEGLVAKEPFRGYAANHFLGLERLVELYELRSLLEPGVAALAAARRSEDHIVELARLAVMPTVKSDAEVAEAVQSASDTDLRFHVGIANCTGNPQIVEDVRRIHERNIPFRYFTQHSADRSLASAEHVAILEAIRSGDSTAAEQAMRRHLTLSVTRITSSATGDK